MRAEFPGRTCFLSSHRGIAPNSPADLEISNALLLTESLILDRTDLRFRPFAIPFDIFMHFHIASPVVNSYFDAVEPGRTFAGETCEKYNDRRCRSSKCRALSLG